MFYLALFISFALFLMLVANPEEWLARFTSFLKEHHIYHD